MAIKLGTFLEHKKLKFKGNEYLLINPWGGLFGSIATKEQYQNFEDSFAYLTGNGDILRYGVKIGTISDIEWLKEEEKEK